jgi:hypothetical protein
MGPFRRASVPCGRSSRFRVRPCRRRIGSDGLHLERDGGGSPARGSCVMRHLTRSRSAVACQACGACVRGHGFAGGHQLARHACRGPADGPRAPLSAVVGRPGFNGGHLERGAAGSPRIDPTSGPAKHDNRARSRRPCLAVLRVRCVRSTARPRRIGSVVELCMPGAPRPVPGRPHPLRCPPLSARTPRHRPGGHQHPTSAARRYPPGVRAATEDRVHPRRARMPGGTVSRLGPLGIRPRQDRAGREFRLDAAEGSP